MAVRFYKRNLLSPNHFVVRVVHGYSFTLGVYRVVGGLCPRGRWQSHDAGDGTEGMSRDAADTVC